MAEGPFTIQYALEAVADAKLLRAHDRRKGLDAIDAHLHHSPTQIRRTRIKAMRQPFWSQCRLRVEDFLVYYDVDVAQRAMNALRVLEKGQRPTRERPNHETDRADP
jgi:hypothetical protein